MIELCATVPNEALKSPTRPHYYSVPDGGAQYCDDRVCVSVFVCPQSYLPNYTSDLLQIFCACYLWLWLGPHLTA